MKRAALFTIGAGLGAAIAVALSFIPASADTTPTPYAAVEVAPARVEMPVPDGRIIRRQFSIANLSSSPETVAIEPVDFTITDDGTYEWLQPGATPWSIAPGLTVSAVSVHLAPKTATKLTVTYLPIVTDHIRAGALLFTPTLDGAADGSAGNFGVAVKVQAIVPVLAIPSGSNGKLDQRVKLASQPISLHLSGVLNVGPISFAEPGVLHVHATFRNIGNALVRFDPWVTWSNLGRDFWNQELPPAVAMPNQDATVNGSTTANLPGQGTVDLTPTFGIVRVRVTATPILLGEAGPTATQERWVIVAPFRIIGLVLAVLLGAYVGARRARSDRGIPQGA